MLSRWDFSVHVFCFRHCRVYFRHCRVYSRHCQKYTRQCRKQANLISAVSFCYVYDLFLAKKKHSRLSVNSLIIRECFLRSGRRGSNSWPSAWEANVRFVLFVCILAIIILMKTVFVKLLWNKCRNCVKRSLLWFPEHISFSK